MDGRHFPQARFALQLWRVCRLSAANGTQDSEDPGLTDAHHCFSSVSSIRELQSSQRETPVTGLRPDARTLTANRYIEAGEEIHRRETPVHRNVRRLVGREIGAARLSRVANIEVVIGIGAGKDLVSAGGDII